ncbi:MAG: GNAT family N-acetyltransferase [Rhodopila sp.]|jgi:RimJ/RimL family protein N-acetyltransferase
MSDSVISGSVEISELETPRLILRPLEIADAPAVQALFPQWEVVRFLDAVVPWPYPPDGAARYIGELALPDMRQGEAWHWSIRPRTAPETLIGAITVRHKPGDNRGFWLDPSWQGQGLMTEACEVVTDFWFGALEQPVLRVVKAVANRRSRRISERSFMRVIDIIERDFVGGRMLAEEWELTRAEWFRRPR